MTEFRLKKHTKISFRSMIEIWEGDRLIGCIYPADGGVRIVSKHFDTGLPRTVKSSDTEITFDPGSASGLVPPALTVRIVEGS